MEYLKYLSRPYSKYLSVAEWESLTGKSIRSSYTFEKECKEAFDLADQRRRPSEYLSANFPAPPRAQIADSSLHLLGGEAAPFPSTRIIVGLWPSISREKIRSFIPIGENSSSIVRNTLGLRRVLEATRSEHMLFNGF